MAGWEAIRECNLYGYRRGVGAFHVEVVRAYTGDWRVYEYRNGVMLRGNAYSTTDFPQAMQIARASLRKEGKVMQCAS